MAASDAMKQASTLLDSVEDLLSSSDWQQRMPVLLRLADGVELESEELITHAFLLLLTLLIIFFLDVFFLIAYASRQCGGLRRKM